MGPGERIKQRREGTDQRKAKRKQTGKKKKTSGNEDESERGS